jgi:hypothetical protein
MWGCKGEREGEEDLGQDSLGDLPSLVSILKETRRIRERGVERGWLG